MSEEMYDVVKKGSPITICLDFDGVVHSYTSGWQGMEVKDPPTPGALEFVHWLVAKGFRVVICTTRMSGSVNGAKIYEMGWHVAQWLQKWGFPEEAEIMGDKPIASLYIDDRGWRFNGDFARVKDFLELNPKPGSWVDNALGSD